MWVWRNYFLLLLKRSVKMLFKALSGFLIMGIVVIGSVVFVSYVMLQSHILPTMQVGICIPDSENVSKMGAKYISAIDSVKSICSFNYMDKEDALHQLKNGDLQAVIALPEGFYHDVNVGLNPPAQLYLTEGESVQKNLFLTLVESGVFYLQIAESGVYAALDAFQLFNLSVDSSSLGDDIAICYAKEILVRENVFRNRFVSPFGEMTIIQYYYVTGMTLLLLIFSLNFSFLYDKNSRELEDQLAIYGLKGMGLQVLKIGVESIILFIIGSLLYFISLAVFSITNSYFVVFEMRFLLDLLFVCVGMATVMHTLFSIFSGLENGKSRQWGVFVIVILVALSCGLFFPTTFLPKAVAQIGEILPFRYFANVLGYGLFEQSSLLGLFHNTSIMGYALSLFMIIMWILIWFGIGAVVSWKKSDCI